MALLPSKMFRGIETSETLERITVISLALLPFPFEQRNTFMLRQQDNRVIFFNFESLN